MQLRRLWPSIAALGLTILTLDARAETCALVKTFDEEIGKLGELRDDNNRRDWLLIEYLRTESGRREGKAATELKQSQASKAAQVNQASREMAAVKMGVDASFDEESADCLTVKKTLATYQSAEASQKDLLARFYTKDFPFLDACETKVSEAMLHESLAKPALDPRARRAYLGLRCVREKQRQPFPGLNAVAPALSLCDVKDWYGLGLCLRRAISGVAASKP